MKRTLEAYNYIRFITGKRFDKVTVEPFFKVWDKKQRRERTVWKDIEDDSRWYVIQYGLLWPYGE